MQTMTLIESRTNAFGIEVRHESDDVTSDRLRAYRNGELVAEQRVSCRGRSLRDPEISEEHSPEVRAELERALSEALRVYRDGRGLE